MWTKRYLLAIIFLSISLCCSTDKATQRVQAASNNFDCTTVSEVPQLECEALVDLYNSTDGPNWVKQDGWLTTTAPCSWSGVKCSDGFVTRLDLDNDNDGNGLSGALPATIANFTNLTSLDLSFNQLSSVPAEIGNLSNLRILDLYSNELSSVPAETWTLSNLTSLGLSGNELGSVPAEIGNLSNLTGLYLSSNQLSSMPAEIGNLSNLTSLYLGSNELSSVPAEIGNLSNLTSLYLSYNQLSSVPAEIGNLSNLERLYLYSNQLSSMPAEIGNLSNLERLYLYSNQLSSVPAEIGNLSKLEWLYLYSNQLSSMPAEIGNLSNLERLYLSSNQLSSVPAEVGNLSNLTELNLDSNQLSSVPAEIGNLSNLTELSLVGNQLSSVPAEIGNLSNLTRLDLSRNQLSSVPAEIGNLSNLTELDLDHNELSSVPAEIGNLSNLKTLYLGSNELSSVPPEIGNLSNLRMLYLHSNELSSVPAEIGNLSNLTELYLHSNELSSVPAEIGNLSNLKTLYLGSNELSSVPAEIGNLSNLRTLYLRSNQLSSVPAEIVNLSNLTYLSLGSNQLSSVPAEIGNLSKLEWLDLDSNQLSSVPAEIGNLSKLEWLDLDSNQLSSVPAEIGNLSNLTRLDLSRNQLSSVPAEIGNLSNLTRLGLAHNRIAAPDATLLPILDEIDSDWRATQTVDPTNLIATALSGNSIQLSWEPVEFTEKGGLYEISRATAGTFTVHDTVSDKSSNSYIITDLTPDTTYFFRIRTYTPAHDGENTDPDDTWDDQPNELWSEYSTTVSATTLELASTPVVPTATPTRLPISTPTLTPPSAPGMDIYEADDICQQARNLSTDASNQPHSFHQEDDEDWVTFELRSGVSYRLFAESTSPHAEPQLDIYLLCDDLPEFPNTPNLGNDAELIFTAPASGQYYARIKNRDGDLFGEDVTYQLTLTTQSTGGDLAIIITGHDDKFSLQQNIFVSANRAYRTFLAGGIPKDRIRYLSLMDDSGGDERGDADYDGRSDIDTHSTVANIEQVITEWAVDQADSKSRVFIYLIDHGLFDYMLIQGDDDPLWVDVLDGWLTELELATDVPIAVVYEACKSGSFIYGAKSLSDPNRVIITSTDDELNAFPMLNGGAHFSDAFFSAVRRGENFYDAFQQGRQASSETQLKQSPKLDDNGDNKFSRSDGDLARTWTLDRFSATTVRPLFDMPQAPQSILSGEGRIEVSVSNPSAVTAVWADVYGPDFVEPSPAEDGVMPALVLDRIEFSDNNSDGTFVGLYDNFTLAGDYRFVIYGQAGEDDLLMPTVLEMAYGGEGVDGQAPTPGGYAVYLPVIAR